MPTETLRGTQGKEPDPPSLIHTSEPAKTVKTTGDLVKEIWFNSAVFMVSPHPVRGNAVALTMQGQSMAIQVATLTVENGSVKEAFWETPFSGRPPEWKDALLDLVNQHGFLVLGYVERGSR